jgi:hypothetical protein
MLKIELQLMFKRSVSLLLAGCAADCYSLLTARCRRIRFTELCVYDKGSDRGGQLSLKKL